MSSVCLQLGNATVNDSSSYTQTFVAKTADDIASARNGIAAASLDKLDLIVDGSELASVYNPMELATWTPFLSPTCVVTIQIRGANNGKVDLQPINTSFLLAGLVGASERREADGSRVMTATKPKVIPKIGAAPLRKKTNVVTVNLGNFGLDGGNDDDDDADVIDEDGLLDDNVLAPPPAMSAQSAAKDDDCAGRKPCDNCSCGRAEIYAAEMAGNGGADVQPKSTAVPSSNCGKCNLGDAFRCASCPFLGKPAFKAGEEHVVLQMTDDL